MSDDSKLDFILDLDAQSFVGQAQGALDKVEQIGKAIESLGSVIGIAGAAFLAAKATLDLTFEAESLKSINAQFEILARNAGLVPEQLKEGLDKAADGLIDDDRLLQLANEAMIKLGDSAGRMPEIMEIARKASIVTGQDITQVFQQITQAVTSGRTETLRMMGIFVDSQAAIRKFAEANGVAVNTLSDAGKRQAVLNAALEDAEKRYKSVDASIKPVTDSWTRMKNAISDLYQTFALGFDALFGPTVRKIVDSIAGLAAAFKKIGVSAFGTETEKASIHLEAYQGSLKAAQGYLEMFQAQLAKTKDPEAIKRLTAEIDTQKQKIAEAQAQIEKYNKTVSEARGPSATATGGKKKSQENIVDNTLVLQQEAAFNREINSLAQQRLQAEAANAQSTVAIDRQAQQERLLLQQQADSQIAQIRANKDLNEQQKRQEELIIAQTAAQKQLQVEEDLQKKKIAALDRYTAHAKSDADGIARAFETGSKKSQIAQQDFGAVGARVFSSFSKNATSSLEAFGAGQKSASEAAKGFIFGMLADEAEQRGQIMMLSSIWPPNPAGLAAGAALVALAGFLRSQSSTASSGGGTAAIGSGGGGGGTGFGSSDSTLNDMQQKQAQKAVTINIAGNYFETEQTKQRLVEMINETTDATGYTVRTV